MFMEVISNLSDKQVKIVKDLGFSSLLGLCCSYVPNDLYHWLVGNFDTDTRSLNLPNGFSFTLNAKCVHKVLEIPSGSKEIHCKGSLESLKFFQSAIFSEGCTPSVRELCSLVTRELVGDEFARIFMLLSLSAFLCPNTRNVCSTRYYDAVINVTSVEDYDWCTFVLDWLVAYIKKYQKMTVKKPDDIIGGCAFLLVVCYLEFLSTSDYNIGNQCPRLHVWSTRLVQAFAYLDYIPDSNCKFGRLQLKHICCTPFKDCFSSDVDTDFVPNELKCLVEDKFAESSQKIGNVLISDVFKLLKQSVSPNSFPAVSLSLHKMLQFLSTQCSQIISNTSSTFLEETDSDSDAQCSYLQPPKMDSPQSEAGFHSSFFDVDNQPFLDDNLLCSEFESLNVSYERFFLKKLDVQLRNTTNVFNDDNALNSEVFNYLLQDTSTAAKNCCPEKRVTNPLESVFCNAQKILPEQVTPINTSQPQDVTSVHVNVPVTGFPKEETTCSDSDRLSNFLHSSAKNISEKLGPQYVSRAFYSEEINCSLMRDLRGGFRKCNDCIEEEGRAMDEEGTAMSGSDKNKDTPNKSCKMIHAGIAEIEFYNLLVNNINRKTQSVRIFQIGNTWVDQFKLTLSIMNGGWMHFHVMDCFCKMLAWQQEMFYFANGYDSEEFIHQQYLNHSVATILMTPGLKHSNYKKEFLLTIGLDFEKGGLVHIPCYSNKMWVLITVNLLDMRFDILTSEINIEETKSLVHTVIHNFRSFYLIAYPDNSKYNIREFDVCYIDVPKHKNRYDSGVFILTFIQTYNGKTVEVFTHNDVDALRAKLVYQLVSSSCNEAQSAIFHKFLVDHGLI